MTTSPVHLHDGRAHTIAEHGVGHLLAWCGATIGAIVLVDKPDALMAEMEKRSTEAGSPIVWGSKLPDRVTCAECASSFRDALERVGETVCTAPCPRPVLECPPYGAPCPSDCPRRYS